MDQGFDRGRTLWLRTVGERKKNYSGGRNGSFNKGGPREVKRTECHPSWRCCWCWVLIRVVGSEVISEGPIQQTDWSRSGRRNNHLCHPAYREKRRTTELRATLDVENHFSNHTMTHPSKYSMASTQHWITARFALLMWRERAANWDVSQSATHAYQRKTRLSDSTVELCKCVVWYRSTMPRKTPPRSSSSRIDLHYLLPQLRRATRLSFSCKLYTHLHVAT